MIRSIASYDKAQQELVWRSEEPWKNGLRDKSISGDICNRVLIEFLRNRFPKICFNAGIITKADSHPVKYKHSDPRLSPQIDIIAFTGEPFYHVVDYALVPVKNVKFTVETKKWTSPRKLRPQTKKLRKMEEFTRRPALLVAFRHDGELDSLLRQFRRDSLFAFSARKNDLIPGELFRLCKRVVSLAT